MLENDKRTNTICIARKHCLLFKNKNMGINQTRDAEPMLYFVFMLVQSRRRWTSINPTLAQVFVFAGVTLDLCLETLG